MDYETIIKGTIEKCRFNPLLFGQCYFGHYMVDKNDEIIPCSRFQKEFCDKSSHAILSDNPQAIVFGAPRENAKTTWATIAVIWALMYKHKQFAVILSDTTTQARKILADVRHELEENQFLRDSFGDMVGKIWQADEIELTNGTKIMCAGSGKGIRGAKNKEKRPDIIIGDDLENDENVRSPEQRNKLEEWWTKAVMKLGKDATVIVVGTVLHYDSLLKRLINNPLYQSSVYRSVYQWSASGLWEGWKRIILNIDNKNRMDDAYKFYLNNEEAMLAGTEVLWKEGDPYYNLMLTLTRDGLPSFNSEKQNEPLDADECIFNFTDENFYDRDDLLDLQHYRIIGGCDPSLGKNITKGDYSAIIIVAISPQGFIHVLEADIERRKPDRIIQRIIEYGEKYKFDAFYIEDIAFQEFFKQKTIDEVRRQGLEYKIPISAIENSGTKKDIRIQSMSPYVTNGTLKFLKGQKMLLEQMQYYPLADHDDGCDALEFCCRFAHFGKARARGKKIKSTMLTKDISKNKTW